MFKNSAKSHITTVPATWAPTLSNATNATVVYAKWHREGQFLIATVHITWAGAGAGGNFTVSLPHTMDTNYITGGTSTVEPTKSRLGIGQWLDNGTAYYTIHALYNSTTTVQISNNTGILQGTDLASGDAIRLDIKAPIVGWI